MSMRGVSVQALISMVWVPFVQTRIVPDRSAVTTRMVSNVGPDALGGEGAVAGRDGDSAPPTHDTNNATAMHSTDTVARRVP